MLKSLRLRRFKAFGDTGEIELRPITVIAGANSSGKSSIFQSLLLLKQSLEAESRVGHVSLDGRFVEVASLADLSHGKPAPRSARIGYDFTLANTMPKWRAQRFFPRLDLRGQQHEIITVVRAEFREVRLADGRSAVFASSLDIETSLNGRRGPQLRIRRRSSDDAVARVVGGPVPLPGLPPDHEVTGARGRSFLPDFLVLSKGSQDGADNLRPLPRIFETPLRDLADQLENHLDYLGPLREKPRRAYLHTAASSADIGQRGEFAAQLLWFERDRKVRYRSSASAKARELSLLDAVNSAFHDLGVTQRLDVRSMRQVTYQMLFSLGTSKKQVTISDVGFGVSQLLPIVVMALRSEPGSLLLLEQPEIHLHPRLQANLADFLLGAAMDGKRMLVETHSDHFVDRLRRRIAEDDANTLSASVSVLFARAPTAGGGTHLESLRIDPRGAIVNWPTDFMPESGAEAQAIVRAALRKRH